MLEGKELEKQIGDFGSASLDLTPELKVKMEVKLEKEIDILAELHKYVEKTETKLDDKFVAGLEAVLALAKAKA